VRISLQQDMNSDVPSDSRAREAASYIAELSSELARLAREHGLSGLAYLLDIARLEAEMNSGRAVGPQPDKPA
jgi:hypothetical protein